jgi:hypothetical protein
VDKLAHSLDVVVAPLKNTNFVRDGAVAQLVDAQREVDKGWKLNGGKVVAVRVHHEANVRRRGRVQRAVLYEVGVDDRVEAAGGRGGG